MDHKTPRRWGLPRYALVCALLAVCGDADEPNGIEYDLATIIDVSRVTRHVPEDIFSYGEEVHVQFDRDPGEVGIAYGGRPGPDVAGVGTLRAFAIVGSPIVLTWGRDGSRTLEYPTIVDDSGPPSLESTFPDPRDAPPRAADINASGVTLRFNEPIHDVGRLIQKWEITAAGIKDTRSVTWEPKLVLDGATVVFLPTGDREFAAAETYQARASGRSAFDDRHDFVYAFDFRTAQ